MKTTIGVIGGGNMGAAIMNGIRTRYKVLVCEKDPARVSFLKKRFNLKVQDLDKVISQASILILAVKPQDFDQILQEIKPLAGKDKLIISIAAGITTLYIEKRLKGARIIRTMPNLPAQVGFGMTALCKGKYATSNDVHSASKILENIGDIVVIDEKWMDAVTAVSGSGPAYVFLFVECFMKASEALGLTRPTSEKLVKQTLKGSLELLQRQKEDAASLRSKVTSKGGTTQAAMDVFFRHDFEDIFKNALKAARDRARELAKK